MSTATDTIADQVAAHEANMATVFSEEAKVSFAREKAEMLTRSVPAGAVKPGTQIPGAEVVDAHGRSTTFEKACGGKPAVVVLYRGGWCPYSSIALRTYQTALLPELRERGVELIALSPQNPDGLRTAGEVNDLSFTLLSDPGCGFADALGVATTPTDVARHLRSTVGLDVAATNVDGTDTLPLPTALVVDSGGVVRWVDICTDSIIWPEAGEILETVTGVLRKVGL